MIVFVDFEASRLAEGSWPVEVGLTWHDRGRGHTASRLIRPDPGWSMDLWSHESAEVHGIALDELAAAEPAADVAP